MDVEPDVLEHVIARTRKLGPRRVEVEITRLHELVSHFDQWFGFKVAAGEVEVDGLAREFVLGLYQDEFFAHEARTVCEAWWESFPVLDLHVKAYRCVGEGIDDGVSDE